MVIPTPSPTSTANSDPEQSSADTAKVTDESFRYDDSLVRAFLTATLFWGLMAAIAGLLVAVMLVVPELFSSLGAPREYLSFGRIRPMHTNIAVFAFAGNAVFAAVYYSTQRLCKTPMFSATLGWLHWLSWQSIILVGVSTLPMGLTQGKEFAELEWPMDLAIAVSWIGFFGTNFFFTIAKRREPHLYVSLWFYIATILFVAVMHVINSVVLPISPGKSYSWYAGVQDALMQWWYGHNAVSFLLLMPFLGLMYYFIPKATGKPIRSYPLAILHFWALVLIYVWAGPHHLHHTTVPEWITSLGMIFGVLLWMPLWGGFWNGLMTIRDSFARVRSEPTLWFFAAAVLFFGWVTLEGPLLSIKSVNGLTQYSDWTIAHVHAGTLGWNGMLTFGMAYWLIPRVFQTKLWSPRLVATHFWLALAGVLLTILPLYAAGLTQSVMWYSLNETGRLAYPEFLTALNEVKPFWWARILGGACFFVGLCAITLNHLMTWSKRPKSYAPLNIPRTVTSQEDDSIPATPSPLENAPVLDLAKSIDVVRQLHWHREWERLPGRFVGVLVGVMLLAGVVQLLPVAAIRASIPAVTEAQPYTPLELVGRDIFIAEGCFNCHSQMVRPIVAETLRYGEFSKPEDSYYDHPFQWGSRRIGPDLARVGGRQDNFWHWKHLMDPQEVSEGSVMPEFSHLATEPLNFAATVDRVWAAKRLGAEYDFSVDEAPEIAREQAERVAAELVSRGGPIRVMRRERPPLMAYETQAIALIAYLQRLGVPPSVAPIPETTPEDVATSDSPNNRLDGPNNMLEGPYNTLASKRSVP